MSFIGCAVMLLTSMAFAQVEDPPWRESADDPAHAAKLLEAVRDNVFSFDDPAFYWFCRYVGAGKADAALGNAPTGDPVPWKRLLERPSDYRGKPVLLEGILQTRHAFDISNREGLGRLYQCELADIGTQALCAIVCTQDPAEVPIHSRVRVKGFFIKVRAYQTTAGDGGAGPLIVAKRLHLVRPPASGIPGGGPGSVVDRWMIPAVVVLAFVWLLLRRAARKTVTGPSFPSVKNRGTEGSKDDFAWMSRNPSVPPGVSNESSPEAKSKIRRGGT